MKTLTIACGVALLFLGCGRDKSEFPEFSDLKRNNFKGKTASVTISVHACDSLGNEKELMECCTTVSDYDENGLLLKSLNVNHLGEILSKEINESFQNGLPSKVLTYSGSSLVREMVYQLNDSMRHSSFFVRDSSGRVLVDVRNIRQNNLGLIEYLEFLGPDSLLKFSEESVYSNGNLIESIRRGADKAILSRYKANYNEKDEGIEESYFEMQDGKEVNLKTQRHSYPDHDAYGNWTKQIQWDERGKANQVTKRQIKYFE